MLIALSLMGCAGRTDVIAVPQEAAPVPALTAAQAALFNCQPDADVRDYSGDALKSALDYAYAERAVARDCRSKNQELIKIAVDPVGAAAVVSVPSAK